jgi:hypothetical protein
MFVTLTGGGGREFYYSEVCLSALACPLVNVGWEQIKSLINAVTEHIFALRHLQICNVVVHILALTVCIIHGPVGNSSNA